MRLKFYLFIIIALIVSSIILIKDNPPILPWKENPYYWSIDDKPVLLLGGSDDDNLFQWPRDRLLDQLDRLKAAGGNLIRNTMSDRKDQGFEVYPFQREENGLYDLDHWNREYWTRFKRLLRETEKRAIIVQIEIWDRFDYTDARGNINWQLNPYNPKNNINYTYAQSKFSERYPDHPGMNKQPFFFTTPGQDNNLVVLQYQQKFVNKLLDISLRYGNVLYCIDNETNGDEQWSAYWAQYIKQRSSQKGKNIFVTEMWDAWDLTSDEHKRTFDHPELYDFVDVSQNNANRGIRHWQNFLYVKKYLSKHPRPINTTKTYGADHYRDGHSDQDGIERFWRHLLAGAASLRFHRPGAGLGLGDKAVASIRAARKLESVIPLWTVEPANELLSGCEENEAYLSADKGQNYMVYFPSEGEVIVDVSSTKGPLKSRWINIDTGEWGPTEKSDESDQLLLKTPEKGNWVVAITLRK